MRLFHVPRLAMLLAGLFLAAATITVDHAEARRGGSFGSRGTRTFQSAPPTRTAPQPTAPVERSMTPSTGPAATTNSAARQPQAGPQRPGFMNGFGGSMLRGLLIGGLIGVLLGQGFGGLAGMFGLLVQVLLIGVLIMFAMRFFRSRQEPALAGVPGGFGRSEAPRQAHDEAAFRMPGIGSGAAAPVTTEIKLDQRDLDRFEQLLTEVQEAFDHEDHAGLRRLVTPEMVSFLSEELADNAKNGVRNEVSDVRLLQADIAESWREDGRDYATAALLYDARDVTRNRATGEVVSGDPTQPTETTELWTFVRQSGGDWKLSAIQAA